MNRLMLTGVALSAVLLAACGGSEIVVQAQIEGAEGQPTALRDLPIRALPYDRDAIFDSLRAQYPEPEPEIPADLMLLRDSIAAAQDVWRSATARWNEGRDSLAKINNALKTLNRASGQYVVMFREFNALDAQVSAAQRTMDQSFERSTQIRNRYESRANDLKLQREQWADAAYADFTDIKNARLKEMRLEERADTTDANGVARFERVKKGDWWIQARYDLPFEELYWNLPVQATGGVIQVQLTRQNAQVRPKL